MLTKTDIATDEVTEYTWDYRNRLTNVTVKDSSENVIQESDYTYDLFDRRIGVEVDPDGDGQQSSTETWTAYDGANPYADFDGSEDLLEQYLYGPGVDMILARMDDSQDVDWYLTDHLGTVRDIADTDGTILDHIEYDSFGQILSESSPANGDRFKFTGREYDSATGLYYYRARYYDPAIGRFISEDPIGFAARDPNIYRYVGNMPTTATDPSGLVIDNPWLDEGSTRVGQQIATKYEVAPPRMFRGRDGRLYIQERETVIGVFKLQRFQCRYSPAGVAEKKIELEQTAVAGDAWSKATAAGRRKDAYLLMISYLGAAGPVRGAAAALLIAAAEEARRDEARFTQIAVAADGRVRGAESNLRLLAGAAWETRWFEEGTTERILGLRNIGQPRLAIEATIPNYGSGGGS